MKQSQSNETRLYEGENVFIKAKIIRLPHPNYADHYFGIDVWIQSDEGQHNPSVYKMLTVTKDMIVRAEEDDTIKNKLIEEKYREAQALYPWLEENLTPYPERNRSQNSVIAMILKALEECYNQGGEAKLEEALEKLREYKKNKKYTREQKGKEIFYWSAEMMDKRNREAEGGDT